MKRKTENSHSESCFLQAIRVTHDLLFEKKWPAKKAAARLAELAIHLGSSDNITVIVIRFFHGPDQYSDNNDS
jgi:serine/threonine protein phosphatase PrpC